MKEKIRVLFIHNRLMCGGTEQALFDLVSLMDPERFDITVFVQRNDGMWDGRFVKAGIRVIYDYSCRKATWNPFVKVNNLHKKLRTAAAYRRNGEGLLDICCPEGMDVVVSYATSEYEEMAFFRNAKTVKYIHGDLETNPQYRSQILENKALLDRFDRIVCVSNKSYQSFCRYTGRTEGVQMLFNPINSEYIRCQAACPVELPKEETLICAVGRLSYEKGFERLILIHKKLLDQGIRHKLVIVGDGVERSYVERTIMASETQDSVILAGYQDNPYPYIAASRFLVCSSYTEGLPVVAMESLSLGVPVVAAVPSVEELFGHEQCGVITGNDNASLEAGIRSMLTEEDIYRRIKENAVRCSAFFDGKRMARDVEDMLVKLVEER